MNLNIFKCENGWIITKNNYDNNGNVYSNIYPSKPSPLNHQEQFIFSNMEDLITWMKTTFVVERLNK